MNEEQNASIVQGERQSEGLNFQVCISLNDIDDYIEIPADGEWHLISCCNGNVVYDNIEVHNRVLSEDEINSAFRVFGNYADRVLSKEELEIIHRLLNDHSEIKSWQIRNNILYLEVEEEI